MVVSWFYPNAADFKSATSIEIYMARTDAYGLLALALLTTFLSGAVTWTPNELTFALRNVGQKRNGSEDPYRMPVLAVTILHHLATGYWSGLQCLSDQTVSEAMWVGVVGSWGLAALGIWAWVIGTERGEKAVEKRVTRARGKAT
ncbi:MAG: hypothetical protein M1828_004307 [Chrysothrix sp. TS-e1954]|nr:MAG: hypothetical protein M1828_004307 [Chrysothrix sp. TS-e1954]